MIKSNELRIGNYIIDMCDGNICQVTSGKIIDYGLVYMKKIPLTEQWLLDFGFRLSINKEMDCGHAILGEFNIWVDKGKLIYWTVKGSVELKYVHQLQNLYFVLMDKELTLKKNIDI